MASPFGRLLAAPIKKPLLQRLQDPLPTVSIVGGIVELPFLRGTNYSGQESGSSIYAFPFDAALDYFAAKGVSAIRLPITMERLGFTPGGGESFTEPYATYVEQTIAKCLSRGMKVIFDPHSSLRFRVGGAIVDDQVTGGTEIIIGEDARYTAAQFGGWLVKAWQRFCRDPNVVLGFANEPYGVNAPTYYSTVQTGIDAVRQAGAKNLLLINGAGYNTLDWVATGPGSNRALVGQLVDPLDNWAIDIHHYFDPYSAGATTEVIEGFMANVVGFTEFMRGAGLKAVVGEFGGATDARSMSAVSEFLTYVEGNQDVFIGWTWWTTVQYQQDYRYNLLPTELTSAEVAGPYTDRAQMKLLAPLFEGKAKAPQYLAAPVFTGVPTIGGLAKATFGQLVAFPAATIGRQWQRTIDGTNWTDIAGATHDDYAITMTSDGALGLRRHDIATNEHGSASTYSSTSGPISSVTTLSATDRTSTVGLFDNNLSAYNTGASPRPEVRGTNGRSGGKRFFETTMLDNAMNAGAHLGLTVTAYVLGSGVDVGTTGIAVSGGGSIFGNGAERGRLGVSIVMGDVVGLAADLGAKRLWVRRNGGFWNGIEAADPGTGTSGIDITFLGTGPLFPTFDLVFSSSIKVNFGGTAYLFPAPEDFGAW